MERGRGRWISGGDGDSTSLTRRRLIQGAVVLAGGLVFPTDRLRAAGGYTISSEARRALGASPLIYVSPLLADGAESRCHAEVWYFFDEDSVVIFTATDRWKARAVRTGRDRARLWVGNFGPVGRAKDRYRSAPTFVARGGIETERAVFDRLMASYATRYADEWGKWGPRFEKGYKDGSRVMIRYTPTGD